MPTGVRPLSCIFSSRLHIREDEIATLGVFFDEIFLPYPYGVDPAAIHLPWFHDSGVVGIGTYMLEGVRREFQAWKEKYKLLFEEGVLRTLPPPIKETDELPAGYINALHKRSYSESLGK